jgi:hypothetical protein
MALSLAYFLAAALVAEGAAQPPCPRSRLPAYAHNDYENPRPLLDAVRLGFSGVEADVFLVDGVLRVGHDRRRARKGKTLEALYLSPLREIISRCGRLTPDSRGFLLAVEIKESSQKTFDALETLLDRYRELFAPASSSRGAIEVILVGWHPPLSRLRPPAPVPFRIQHRISGRSDVLAVGDDVRLLSVDYGKTMGRRWSSAANRRGWIEILGSTKRANPNRLLRVHNVPADSTIYGALLDAGVDLIGTRTLARTWQLLQGREVQ